MRITKAGKVWIVDGVVVVESHKGRNDNTIEIQRQFKQKWAAKDFISRWERNQAEVLEMNARAYTMRLAVVTEYLAIRADRAKQLKFEF